MLSFYPGPSRVYDKIPQYVRDAFKAGMLSINHRSPEFVRMSEHTITLLKERLEIPGDYTVFYTSSATECWEIIAQSVIKDRSLHIFNGAFGRKWFEYTRRLHPDAQPLPFEQEQGIDVEQLKAIDIPDVVCLTQNETSNGTQVSNAVLQKIREALPDRLIAVDATSSMAGVFLDFKAADIWFASVQKCFGLPAGLALLICSPSAMKRVKALAENNHYNSLVFMAEMMEKWQTPYTPNVLNIYLLNRVMEDGRPIRVVDQQIQNRYRQWISFLKGRDSIRHLISNPSVHSSTVIPIRAEEDTVTRIKTRAKESGILLGEGYGELKATTFRIANFPALRNKEIRILKSFLDEYQ